jgi:hypothetical protein
MSEMSIIASIDLYDILPPLFKSNFSEGDTKVIWDPENAEETEAMEELYDSLIKRGFTAYEVGKAGKQTKVQVKEFDPELGKLIMIPKIVGG